jgi:hypothetical protein
MNWHAVHTGKENEMGELSRKYMSDAVDIDRCTVVTYISRGAIVGCGIAFPGSLMTPTLAEVRKYWPEAIERPGMAALQPMMLTPGREYTRYQHPYVDYAPAAALAHADVIPELIAAADVICKAEAVAYTEAEAVKAEKRRADRYRKACGTY